MSLLNTRKPASSADGEHHVLRYRRSFSSKVGSGKIDDYGYILYENTVAVEWGIIFAIAMFSNMLSVVGALKFWRFFNAP